MAGQLKASHGRLDVSSEADQVDQSNPQSRECLAEVAVAVRGAPKDVLVGAHIRPHRRTVRPAHGGVTAVAVLLIASAIAAAVAVGQRDQAVAAQHTTIAGGMVAQADRIRDLDSRRALQLDVAAKKTVIASDRTHHDQPRRLGQPLTGYAGAVTGVAFSPDGHTLATSPVMLWDLSDRSQPRRLDVPLIGHTDVVDSVAFLPDGRTLATGSRDSSVILWELTDHTQPRRLGRALTGPGWVTAVVISPDGRTLATASGDRTVTLWDLTDRNQPHPLGQPLTVFAGVAAFSPDGRTLATVSDDHSITLWDLTNRNQPRRLGQPLTGHTDIVNAVAFSPDGHTLATGSRDKTVVLWDMTPA